MLQAVLTEPQLAKYTLPWHSLVQIGNLKYIKLKINWADTPQCASKPFSTQVLAWLGLPETISKVGNTGQMAQKPAKEQWGLPRMRGASSSLWGSTESSASPMSPTHPEVHNGIILRRLVPLPPRHLPWLHDPWHRGLEAAGYCQTWQNMSQKVPIASSLLGLLIIFDLFPLSLRLSSSNAAHLHQHWLWWPLLATPGRKQCSK